MTDYKIIRGPWGKPYVTRDYGPIDWPEGVKEPLNAYLYERPSDISGNLDTKENLSPYHQAQAVTGLMLDKALAVQFKAIVSEHGIHAWEREKQEVKALLTQARMSGGEEYKSGMGSGFHRYAHLVDVYGDAWRDEIILPHAEFDPWLQAYHEAMSELFEVLDDECFVAIDDLDHPDTPDDVRAAGNFDRLLRLKREVKGIPAGTVLIGDVKTGKSDDQYAMKPTIQVAMYARGVRYEQETGRRWPIHEELNREVGALIHVPFSGGGTPRCDIYPLDLNRGWELAKLSNTITTARRMRVLKRDALIRTKVEEGS